MAEGVDIKGIGIAAKDIIMGIAGAAVGAKAGPEGAKAVDKIDKGLDKVISMADPGESRADRADRADKPRTAPATGQPKALPPPATAESTAPASGSESTAEWPPSGEARVTADYLSKLGYPRERIRLILGGGDGATVTEVTNERPPRVVEGTRIAPEDASAVKLTSGSSVPIKAGKPIPDDNVAEGAPVRIVVGRRVPKQRESDSEG